MSVVPALVAAARRRVIRHFQDAGATSAAQAIAPPEGRHLDRRRFEYYLRTGVIREASPGLYYLDEAALTKETAARERVMIPVVIVLTLLAIIGAVIMVLRP